MFRTIVIPKSTPVRLDLPEEFIGKKVEITAHPIKKKSRLKSKTKLNELRKFYSEYNYDLSKFNFNRDELNER